MLLLTELSNDILLSILFYLTIDRPTLCALAASSRRFYSLTPPYIYHNINLRVHYSNPAHEFSKQFEHFQRTINERPPLASLVQKLHLVWFKEQPRTKRIAQSGALINRLLAKLYRLRELELTAFGSVNLHFEPQFLGQNDLKYLRILRINDRNLQVDDIVEYLLSKNLKALHIMDMDTRSSRTEILLHPSHHAQHASSLSLSTLSLGRFHLPQKTLLELLQLFPNLENLDCWIPGDEFFSTYTITHQRPMESALSPAHITLALEPIQHSLLHLNLEDGLGTQWPRNDGSRMNLSSFICLKVLKARAECFFAANTPSGMRKGVYELLPSSLEELHITFGFGWDILFNASSRSEWEHFEENGQNISSETYAWLEEIAEYKARYLDLKLVVITEQINGPRGAAFNRLAWNIPSRLGAAFEGAGVGLCVWLRKPKQGRWR